MPMVCELPNADDVIRGFQCMFDVIQFDSIDFVIDFEINANRTK